MMDKEQHLVSVIIPLYNAELHVAQCIQSVLDQSYTDIEIIVVNDGSTDGSLQVVNQFTAQNMSVLNQQNAGAAAARNTGLRHAKGKYIQFLDADDFMSANKIAEQVRVLDGLDTKLCGCPCVHFKDGDDHRNIDIHIDWFINGVDDTPYFLTAQYGGKLIGDGTGGMTALHSWLLPKALINKAGPWNENLTLDDDGEFMCRVILAAHGILYTSNAVVYYRKYNTSNNVSSLTSKEAHLSLFTSLNLRKKYLLDRRNDELSRRALSRIFHEVAISFYPECPGLTNQAEKTAIELDPNVKPDPYKEYPTKLISDLFGWRFMRRLTRLKVSVKKRLNKATK